MLDAGSSTRALRPLKFTNHLPLAAVSEASMAWKRGPWSTKAKKKIGTDEAHVWGHNDPLWCLASDPGTVESKMAKYLSSFPASHWRPGNGELLETSYAHFHQLEKVAGIMILDINEHSVQFNVIMDWRDPKANIDAMYVALKGHLMLLNGSDGQDCIYQTTKDTNDQVKKGDHASQWDIKFRTGKLRTFKLGLTKNGDLSICMGFHRLQICVRNV